MSGGEEVGCSEKSSSCLSLDSRFFSLLPRPEQSVTFPCNQRAGDAARKGDDLKHLPRFLRPLSARLKSDSRPLFALQSMKSDRVKYSRRRLRGAADSKSERRRAATKNALVIHEWAHQTISFYLSRMSTDKCTEMARWEMEAHGARRPPLKFEWNAFCISHRSLATHLNLMKVLIIISRRINFHCFCNRLLLVRYIYLWIIKHDHCALPRSALLFWSIDGAVMCKRPLAVARRGCYCFFWFLRRLVCHWEDAQQWNDR